MEYLFDGFSYDLRWLVQLAALSGVLTLIAIKAFPHNPISRRAFIVIAALCLLVIPNLIPQSGVTWPLALTSPPDWTFAQALPNAALMLWWLIGSTLIIRRLVQLYRQVRNHARTETINDPRLTSRVEELTDALPQIKKISVNSGSAACASTIVANRIFLPAEWHQWSENTLTAVLAHELVHVQRRDDRWLLLADLIADWYWWLPWLRSLRKRLCQAMEESADDRAAEWFSKAHGYLEGVHAAAIHIGQPTKPIKLPGVVYLEGHSLVQRVARFLEFRNQELDTRGLYWGMLAALVSVPIITGVEFVPHKENYRGGFVSIPATSFEPVSLNQHAVIPNVTSTKRSNVPLRVIDEPSAIYPGKALMGGITGDVVVSYVVTANGTTARAKVLATHPEYQFEKAALKAVELSRYALVRGHNLDSSIAPGASVQVERTFRFAISTELQ